MMTTADLFTAIAERDEQHALRLLDETPELATARSQEGMSALLQALYHGLNELADRIAGLRADLDVFEAAAIGNVPRLRDLLEGDPTLANAWSHDGFTPLHFAAFFGRPDAARVLAEAGADLEARSRNEEFALDARPIHSAAAARQVEVCEILLEAGADVNAAQHGGYTPLLEAAQHGDAPLAQLLLEHGADAFARLDDGRGAAELARAASADGLAERLEQTSAR